MEHFLIHCLTAKELWSLFFLLFEVPWVFPSSVVELFIGKGQEWGREGLGFGNSGTIMDHLEGM